MTTTNSYEVHRAFQNSLPFYNAIMSNDTDRVRDLMKGLGFSTADSAVVEQITFSTNEYALEHS